MTNQHPIMPPDELVRQWLNSKIRLKDAFMVAAQWGADQELEACCEQTDELQLGTCYPVTGDKLRAARRPKPSSLKEQALEELENMVKAAKDFGFGGTDPTAIRRVLEQLDD